MKMLIKNINTNNIDMISDILGIAGLCQCDESIDLCTHFVDMEIYNSFDGEELKDMILHFVINGFAIEFI